MCERGVTTPVDLRNEISIHNSNSSGVLCLMKDLLCWSTAHENISADRL